MAGSRKPRFLKKVWRALRPTVLVLAAIVLFIEEWGWRPLAALAARAARWAPVARLEVHLRRVSPKAAVVIFLVPALLLFPIKIGALWCIHRGQVGFGIVVILAAKLLGTAAVGRLFIVLEPQLTQFAWFVRALAWTRATRRIVKAWLAACWPSRRSRGWLRRWRTRRRRFGRS
ncbi:MAG: hypothetical protein JSR59_24500 [Proteobacteria bacterium]|nr:hypothetical protein [Pseudomonadota bacterium]